MAAKKKSEEKTSKKSKSTKKSKSVKKIKLTFAPVSRVQVFTVVKTILLHY